MSEVKVTADTVDFPVQRAGKPTKTWYKIFGDIKSTSHRPLVALHGGPGFPHNYLLPLVDLTEKHGIPVILYDQLGNGNSTHLPEKMGDTSFWTEQLFLDELDNLLTHLGIDGDYDLLGHSWGGMLAARHATKQPKGLNKLILADSPADMKQWMKNTGELRRQLPQDIQDTLTKHERANTTASKEYQDGIEVFNSQFVCRLNPKPADYVASYDWLIQDPSVFVTTNGPSVFHIIGGLKDWSILADIGKIDVPTLLLNGQFEDKVMAPWFKGIKQVKWVTFANSSHIPHHEERDQYIEVVQLFISGK